VRILKARLELLSQPFEMCEYTARVFQPET